MFAHADSSNRADYGGHLARLGHAVTLALDEFELVRACRAAGPDLILAGVDLVDQGDLDALEEVRSDCRALRC